MSVNSPCCVPIVIPARLHGSGDSGTHSRPSNPLQGTSPWGTACRSSLALLYVGEAPCADSLALLYVGGAPCAAIFLPSGSQESRHAVPLIVHPGLPNKRRRRPQVCRSRLDC